MDEVIINIGEQELKKHDLEQAICKPTNYGRSPDDADFANIKAASMELEKVIYALNVLYNLRDSIALNSK